MQVARAAPKFLLENATLLRELQTKREISTQRGDIWQYSGLMGGFLRMFEVDLRVAVTTPVYASGCGGPPRVV